VWCGRKVCVVSAIAGGGDVDGGSMQFNSQTSGNEFLSALRSQVRWGWPADMYAPIRNLNPIRPFMFWWNTRTMDRYLDKELERRFESKSGGEVKKRKHVIDLALETYINEQSPEK